MQTISLVTQKGGTGKSTLAVNLAAAAQHDGRRVCIIDLDPQGTAMHWFSVRVAPEPAVIDGEVARDLPSTIQKLEGAGYDLVVIDTPGFDAPVTRDAIRAADLCLVPVRPSEADLQATMPTLKAVLALARPFALVINQAPANKQARLTTAVHMRLASEGPVLPSPISTRIDFQYAYALGQSVLEYAQDGKAAQEIEDLWGVVKKRLDDATAQAQRSSGSPYRPGNGGRKPGPERNSAPVRAFG